MIRAVRFLIAVAVFGMVMVSTLPAKAAIQGLSVAFGTAFIFEEQAGSVGSEMRSPWNLRAVVAREQFDFVFDISSFNVATGSDYLTVDRARNEFIFGMRKNIMAEAFWMPKVGAHLGLIHESVQTTFGGVGQAVSSPLQAEFALSATLVRSFESGINLQAEARASAAPRNIPKWLPSMHLLVGWNF
jgi:hypothetical protein